MDEFAAAQKELHKGGVSGWWETTDMGADQWTQLIEAARNPRISHRAIATVLNRWGVEVTVSQVGHWRRSHV
jgi:hypothetical protein